VISQIEFLLDCTGRRFLVKDLGDHTVDSRGWLVNPFDPAILFENWRHGVKQWCIRIDSKGTALALDIIH